MGRLIAIGDIHGRMRMLGRLINQIEPQEFDRLVFLGDYIDRGPDSFEVVEYVIALKQKYPKTITLRGNHEDFVLSFFMGNQKDRHVWLKQNGGEQTMASYRKNGEFLKIHREFYEDLNISWETDEYFFCHAGTRPGVPLDKQKASDLCGIREPFLSSGANFGKIVVHGHTIVHEPTILSNHINIDTGAGEFGPLTAIELPSKRIWQQI
jgi:serine/threonine protein phosphatase 1